MTKHSIKEKMKMKMVVRMIVLKMQRAVMKLNVCAGKRNENRIKVDNLKSKAQPKVSKDEKKSENQVVEPRSRASKNSKKAKRNNSPKEKVRFKALKKFFNNYNEQIGIAFQTFMMFAMAVMLYQILDDWKANTFR